MRALAGHQRRVLFVLAVVITFLVIKVRPALADDDTAHNYSVYCARCHGISGRGDGDYAAKLHKRPRDFADCAMMARIPDTTIVKAIEGGGAAVGLSDEMPSWQGALDDGEITALAGYIRSFCTTARPDLAPLPAH